MDRWNGAAHRYRICAGPICSAAVGIVTARRLELTQRLPCLDSLSLHLFLNLCYIYIYITYIGRHIYIGKGIKSEGKNQRPTWRR